MTTTNIILQLLSDGQWHKGEELGQALSITRAGIWKAMQSMPISIERDKRQGYRIAGGLELLNEKELNKKIESSVKNKYNKLIILNSIPSTNDYLFEQARGNIHDNLICLAEAQSQGKGRRGRTWETPFGHNISCSFLWHYNCDSGQLSGLSQMIALSTVKAIEEATGIEDLKVKWPNDIYHQGKKLSGILIELLAQAHVNTTAIIGIGINGKLPENTQINQPWTDLTNILGAPPPRNRLAAALINHTISTLAEFHMDGLTPHIETWKHYDICAGKQVEIVRNSNDLKGIAEGINRRGELILRDKNNQLHTILSGEASLLLKQR